MKMLNVFVIEIVSIGATFFFWVDFLNFNFDQLHICGEKRYVQGCFGRSY